MGIRKDKYKLVIDDLLSRTVMPLNAPSLQPTVNGLVQMGVDSWPAWNRLKSEPERCTVVAGTNGKGSVCASLEALLLDAGRRVGMYTSPHLVEHTERIRINGIDSSEDLFVKSFDFVKSKVDPTLSHFEMLTLMAVWIFFSGHEIEPMDRVILEVGLGGTWDSTNAVPHGISILTALSLDHQNILGNSLLEIARNKLGIVNAGTKVFHQQFPIEINEEIAEKKRHLGGEWTEVLPPILNVTAGSGACCEGINARPRFSIRYGDLEIPVSLAGKRGAINAATAIAAFEAMGNSIHDHWKSLSKVRWPGRMELVHWKGKSIFLSGDHNVQGVQSLLDILPYYRRKQLHVLAGIGRDKKFDEMLLLLKEIPNSKLYLTETPFKGVAICDYGVWTQKAAGIWASPIKALDSVCSNANEEDMILVTGSLYLVGEIKKDILKS